MNLLGLRKLSNGLKRCAIMKTLIICISVHHGNTEKIARAMAKVLGADLLKPYEADMKKLNQYDLIGFGSGIYDGKHHKSLVDIADKLPRAINKNAFIFSTFGVPAFAVNGGNIKEYIAKNHLLLREKLQSKGRTIIDEFSCVGFNTNSFLKLFGGINNGRPDENDLKNAREFAMKLIRT